MSKVFYIMGKSASGKDSVYSRLLAQQSLCLKPLVLYTTRPIREGETEGVEYHFTDEKHLRDLEARGKVIEERVYQTVFGPWWYFTVDDGSFQTGDTSAISQDTVMEEKPVISQDTVMEEKPVTSQDTVMEEKAAISQDTVMEEKAAISQESAASEESLRGYAASEEAVRGQAASEEMVSVKADNRDYLAIGTLVSYRKMRDYLGKENVIPLYIQIDDRIRLERSILRESEQKEPNYDEVCRRFLADQQDFSEDNLKEAGITNRFSNNGEREACVQAVAEYVRNYRMISKS